MFKFIGHQEWKQYIEDSIFENNSEVLVLRPILFFHDEQKTTMARIRANFTDEAIKKLIHDKFIKII